MGDGDCWVLMFVAAFRAKVSWRGCRGIAGLHVRGLAKNLLRYGYCILGWKPYLGQ